MAYATVADVQARYEQEMDARMVALVETRLEDAELLLRRRIPDLDDKVAADPNYMKLVVMVEADMVLRLIRNPEGYSQESDGNYSYAIYQQVASGRLEVLESEWALLGIQGGMFVIRATLPGACLPEGAIDPYKCWPPPWWEEWV